MWVCVCSSAMVLQQFEYRKVNEPKVSKDKV